MNQVTAIRSVVKKLDFSNDFQAQNKKVGMTTVRWSVKSTDKGNVAYKELVKYILTAKIVGNRVRFCKRFIYTEFADVLCDWPGNSPVLNVIENLWAKL